jgi:predicted nucleic acid-binding Zn ribbon protein
MNAARPPQIRAKNCRACEAPLISGPTTKIYCSKRCARWSYINRRIDAGLPPLPQPAADIPRGIQPDRCVVCGTPLTWGSTGQIRLTCSDSCRAKRAYQRKKEKLAATA